LHLLIDSTGLKLFGKGEWESEKHSRARRSWRKLHLAVDAETAEIVASVLTAKILRDAARLAQVAQFVDRSMGAGMPWPAPVLGRRSDR